MVINQGAGAAGGLGVASIIAGVLGWVVCWVPIINYLLAAVAVILGAIGAALSLTQRGRGMVSCIVGATLGIAQPLFVVIALGALLAAIGIGASAEGFPQTEARKRAAEQRQAETADEAAAAQGPAPAPVVTPPADETNDVEPDQGDDEAEQARLEEVARQVAEARERGRREALERQALARERQYRADLAIWEAQLAAAELRLERAEEALSESEAEHELLCRWLDIDDELRLYRPMAARNEEARRKVRRLEEQLEELGDVDMVEALSYRNVRHRLREAVREAEEQSALVRSEEPRRP